MADQLRYDYLGCNGHPSIQTPNIDALAARGVNFTNAFCQSAVCGPSRMSFYTGRYVFTHGGTWNNIPIRVDEHTMGDFLRPLGYRVGLVGKTLGSLGVGNIGAELFQLATPFDLKFIAHDPYLTETKARELNVELVSLEELFRRSDILSINCPLTADTHHIVNAERLSLMKPTAYLINTARGPVVDQTALTKALQEQRIAGAGLDVLEVEPPPLEDPILQLDNVILTPHALCWTDQCFAGIGAADVQAVLAVMQGQAPVGLVNQAVLEHPSWQKKLANYRQRFGVDR